MKLTLESPLRDLITAGIVDVNKLLDKAVNKEKYRSLVDPILDEYDDQIQVDSSWSCDCVGFHDIVRNRSMRLFHMYVDQGLIKTSNFEDQLRFVAEYGTVEMFEKLSKDKRYKNFKTYGNDFWSRRDRWVVSYCEMMRKACNSEKVDNNVIKFLLNDPTTAKAAAKELRQDAFHTLVCRRNYEMINYCLDDPNFQPVTKLYNKRGRSDFNLSNIIPHIKDDATRKRLYTDPRTAPAKEDIPGMLNDIRGNSEKSTKAYIRLIKDGIATIPEVVKEFRWYMFDDVAIKLRKFILKQDIDPNDFASMILDWHNLEANFNQALLEKGEFDINRHYNVIEAVLSDMSIKDQRSYWQYLIRYFPNLSLELIPLIKDKRLNKIVYTFTDHAERLRYMDNSRLRIPKEKAKQANMLSEVLLA